MSTQKTIIGEQTPAESRNEVRITGQVVNLFKLSNKDIVILTIATAGTGSKFNYPKITWYGDDAKKNRDKHHQKQTLRKHHRLCADNKEIPKR